MTDTTPLREIPARRAAELINVRFWDWINDGWVKITLRPGETIRREKSQTTDEGFCNSLETYLYDETDGSIMATYDSQSRDCDGLFYQGAVLALVHTFWVDESDERVRKQPDFPVGWHARWEPTERYQRDMTAEAAGY